jgi:hypothetical protein
MLLYFSRGSYCMMCVVDGHPTDNGLLVKQQVARADKTATFPFGLPGRTPHQSFAFYVLYRCEHAYLLVCIPACMHTCKGGFLVLQAVFAYYAMSARSRA